ncbi:energy transducer TonB [Parasulfuritortus cantonensis]|uniref:Energy transducer TonB n=1 Tax=Parasulfuritortus cantonensis TaxID=2528202 RepID=A0A4R1B7H2_9PROT|nr:energy transducer TonB [Parasulfuritortus cantonensis]TCJ11743.1 energy transducer TonB [Parasulfuritortus cantonensis]
MSAPPDTPPTAPRGAAGWRLLVRMVVLSAAVHGALITLVPARRFPFLADTVAIDARLAPAPAKVATLASVPSPAPAAAPESLAARPTGMVAPPGRAAPAPVGPALPIDTNWYEARQLDAMPEPLAWVAPDYPAGARQQGLEGWVRLRLRIDEAGVVRQLEVVEAHPPGVFEDSALAAFRQLRFRPARKDGRPVRVQLDMPVRYQLGD